MLVRTRCTPSLIAHVVLLMGAAFLTVPALAEGPAALFWQLDAPSLGEGGADVPGQIRHMPQVARPTSLSEALRPQVRLDYSSQSPLAVRQGDSDMTSWRSDVTSEQAVVPIGCHRTRPALAVGYLRNKSRDRLSYHDGDRQAQVEVSSHETTWAASGEIGFGVTLGAATTSGDASSSASGASLAKYLDLPANAPQWPSVNSDLKSYSLGVTQRIGRLSWGYQHDRSSPTSTLRVARGDTDYTAPMDSASRKREAYVTLDTRHGTFFATRSNYVSDSVGTVFVGLVGRGDTQLHLEEQRGMIGWLQTSRTAMNQIVLDYRRSAFSTYDQGYAGIFPGVFADVYALRGNGQVNTRSVRFGHRRDFGGHWQWAVGLSGHEAKVDGSARMRQSQGLGRDPLTLFEYNVKGGVLRMVALTLGLNHTTDTHRIGLTVTGAYATANDAFRSGTATEPASGSSGRSLRVRPIWTVCMERFF